MRLTAVGWLVVHACWQGLLIGGVAAFGLSLVRPAHARFRYLIGCAGLAMMILAPIATVLSGAGDVRWRMSAATFEVVDQVVSYPALIWWGSVVVPVLGAVWMTGVAGLALAVIREVGRARALRRVGLREAGGDLHRAVHDLRRDIGVRPDVAVSVSTLAPVPMVLGWRHPLILLPATTADRLSPPEVRGILAHELAHVRRRDYLVNLWQIAVDLLLWAHPAARWLSGVVRSEREFCCDDVAVRVVSDAAGYARALAALEDARAGSRLAIAASSGTLLDRIRRIAGQPRRTLTPARGAVLAAAALVVATIIVSAVLLVPPSLPFGTEMRRRTGLPTGASPSPPAAEKRLGEPATGPARLRQPGR